MLRGLQHLWRVLIALSGVLSLLSGPGSTAAAADCWRRSAEQKRTERKPHSDAGHAPAVPSAPFDETSEPEHALCAFMVPKAAKPAVGGTDTPFLTHIDILDIDLSLRQAGRSAVARSEVVHEPSHRRAYHAQAPPRS